MGRFLRAFAALLAVLVSIPVTLAQDTTLVFAAASLKDAIEAVNRVWAQHGGKAVVSLAASSALARQIENGAPAQVFISADLEWMDYVEKRGLLKPGTRANLLGNRLVLIAPADSSVHTSIAPGFPLVRLLAPNGRLALGDPQHVPAGKYAREALRKLGVWASVEARVAGAENVRAALALVARGEAPLGIVYATDALGEPRVRIVAGFGAGLHPPVVYPAAQLRDAGPGAAAYLAFLSSAQAKALFMRYGFTPLN